MPPADSDDEELAPTKDEDGALFQDYGFLASAEMHKQKGNEEFKKAQYYKALKEYDLALEVLVAVLQDSSVTLSEKKFNEWVEVNGKLHLNKSTCYYKLKQWQPAIKEAAACLAGDEPEETKYVDPYIGGKIEHPDRKLGYVTVAYVEKRLPKITQAKAWFRMAKCYAQMGFPIRAQHIILKAREVSDGDKMMMEEISTLWKQVSAVKKKQKEKQAKQFEGYFEKLGDQGGYMTKKAAKGHKYGQMSREQKVMYLERLDDEDGEDDDQFEGYVDNSVPQAPALKQRTMQALKGLGIEAKQKAGDEDDEDGGPPSKAREFNIEEVMAARTQEAAQRVSAWQKAFTERTNRMDPDGLRREKAKKDRKVRLISLDESDDEGGEKES
jgi:tetratricopeptide (TPR) repeat protein